MDFTSFNSSLLLISSITFKQCKGTRLNIPMILMCEDRNDPVETKNPRKPKLRVFLTVFTENFSSNGGITYSWTRVSRTHTSHLGPRRPPTRMGRGSRSPLCRNVPSSWIQLTNPTVNHVTTHFI